MHVSIYLLFNFFFLYCTCSIRRFFCNYLCLTIISTILNNVVWWKSIALLPLIPMLAWFFSHIEQANPSCICLWDTINDLYSFKKWLFFPKFYFIDLINLMLSAFLVPDHLSSFRAWGMLSNIFWKFQVHVSSGPLISSEKANALFARYNFPFWKFVEIFFICLSVLFTEFCPFCLSLTSLWYGHVFKQEFTSYRHGLAILFLQNWFQGCSLPGLVFFFLL